MKKRQEPKRELEEYEAYGEYSYAYRHEDRQSEEEAPEAQETKRRAPAAQTAKARSRSVTGRLLFLVTLLVVGVLVLQNTVFRLESVYVVGNRNKTPQQIAAASGLVRGTNIFSINEEDVRRNLSADHTIVFLGMQKEYPSTIYLYVSEREEVAAVQWRGLQYTLDADGLVMSESSSLVLPEGMPIITGMHATSIHVGQTVGMSEQQQLTAYRSIMSELAQQLCADQISEINLSDVDRIYMVTTDGISVKLGNADSMRAKIGAMRTDIAYLRQLGKSTGMLDVTTPEDAKYTPES